MSLPPPPPPASPPPGYVPYAPAGGTVRPSKGLSTGMIVLFWCAVGTSALLGIALYNRKGVWDDFVNGEGTFSDLDNADSVVGGGVGLHFVVVLVSAILCAVWSNRIANNAKARGVMGVSPGLAAGGWFIPIGWLFVGFSQLRKSVNGVGGKAPSLAKWQGLFIAQAVTGFLISSFGQFETVGDPDELSDRLRNQGFIGLLSAVLYASAAIFAMKSAREINRAVTGE